MTTFIQAAFKKDMIKVSLNGQEVWYDCDPKAKGYAKSQFQPGNEVELIIEQRNGKAYVTQVRRPGQGGGQGSYQQPPQQPNYQQPPVQNPPYQPPAQTPPPYQPQPQSSYAGDFQKPKTPEETEKIMRQSTMACATQAVTVLTGQVNDPSVLTDIIISIYNRLLAEIKK